MIRAAAPLARHDLVTVAPRSWSAVLATRDPCILLPAEALDRLQQWAQHGWPLIVRRRPAGEAPAGIPVGLPLPPSIRKARVAMTIPPSAVWERRVPVTLAAARACAPIGWRGTIDAIIRLGDMVGAAPCVFGALLWQTLTGLDYLHAASDLDLLWPVADPSTLALLIEGLRRIEQECEIVIDAEIGTARGGTSWREILAARGRPDGVVLVKAIGGVALVAVADLFAAEA